MAWGASPRRARPRLVDPYGGLADVGGADCCARSATRRTRFEEDALRMVRAVRLAATLEFDDRAGDARRDRGARADSSRHLSGERIATELDKLLAAPSAVDRAPADGRDRPARGRSPPELAAQRGDPPEQGPRRGPLGPHAADGRRGAAPTGRSSGWPRSLHDIGKPATFADGHFLRPRRRSGPSWPARSSTGCARRAPCASGSSHLVRHHMFSYEPTWSDAAVRRFIGKIGRRTALDELFALREADNVGSAACRRDAGRLDELRARVAGGARAPRSCSTGAAWRSTATT